MLKQVSLTVGIMAFGLFFASQSQAVYAAECPDGTIVDDLNSCLIQNDPTVEQEAPTETPGSTPESPDASGEITEPNEDSLEPIECTGSEWHSYCANEYRCEENEAGEQVCAYVTESTSDENNAPDQAEEEIEEEIEISTEPELWPMIVSASALGFTLLFIIIINLAGRKKS